MYVLPTSRRLSTPRHIVSPAPSLRLALIPLLGFAFLSVAQPAAAQNTWMSGGHPVPLWSNAGAWSLNVVPDGSTDISIPDGTVGDDVSFTNRNTLTVGGPATLTILSPITVTNSGGSGFINNSGSFVNSGTVVNASFGTLNNGGALTNNNTLFNELGGQFSNSGTLDNFGTLDNRISGFIVNTGNLNNQSGGFIINDLSSTIENDHSIGNLAGATFSNSGTLNGSGIFVNSGTVDNSGQLNNVVFNLGGTINNTGGSIRLGDGSDIVGGTLGGAAGTVLLTGAGATATLDGSNNLGFGSLTIRGTYTGDVGTTTNILGTINNQGNIYMNSPGLLNPSLTFLGDTTLQGGGSVTLAKASMVPFGPGGTLTNVDNTIQGAGFIDAGKMQLVNQTSGAILSNTPGGTLLIKGILMTNAGVMGATNSGELDLNVSINNAGGTIAANGGIVELNGNTVFGGTLNNVSGTLGTRTSTTLDGSTAAGALTIRGTYTGDVGTTTNILGTINNQGNIQVNSGGGQNTALTMQSSVTLQGGGTVALANLGGSGVGRIESSLVGLTLTNVDNTVQGVGIIDGGPGALQILNQVGGTIRANTPGGTLELLNTSLTSAGMVQVDAGSILRVTNSPFTQTGGRTQVDGLLSATLGESVSGGMMLGTGTINGNVTMTGGTMRPGGANAPGTLTINGDFLQTGSLFDELIGSTGNGLLMVNGSATLGHNTNLDIEFADGFTPFAGETFTLMDFTTGAGFFLNAPSSGFVMDGFDWTIAYSANDIVLDAVSPVTGEGGGGGTSVPEPGSGALLLSALAAMFACARLRHRVSMPRA